MIPGEIFIKDGDIELNAGRKTVTLDGRQYRRPADPGRLALSFLRDQSGAEVRPQEGARHAARYRRRHRGALRAGPDPRGDAGRSRRRRARSTASARTSWASFEETAHADQDLALRLCRHVRPHHRRPRAARRHRSHHRGREGLHHLRRGGEVRRRQGDPRRHGPEPGHQPAGRGRHRHHQCADPRPLGHRQGRCRPQGRPHRRHRQGRQSRHPARRRPSSSAPAPR